MSAVNIIVGDCRALLAAMEPQSVHCCVTSPPYFGLRDYGVDDQIGLEDRPDNFVAELVSVFREVRRVLRDDGTLWLNLGDSYATDSKWGGSTGGKAAKKLHGLGGGGRYRTRSGLPDKNLIGIPWRVAFALQADGWYLRQDIIWHKPNPMPESVTDRCTKAHEYIFLLSKGPKYYFDNDAIKEQVADATVSRLSQRSLASQVGSGRVPGKTNGNMKAVGGREKRNKRSVWTVTTKPFKGAHFATFPPDLIEPCILAGCPVGGTVLDPFGGAGTTGFVAKQHGRNAILCELNPEYAAMARERIDTPPAARKSKKKPANDNRLADLFGAAA
ncbi:site-specific DNA-methyltransferase [Rhizobium lentis]|uniref:DNA-methyltransferase n=1 Tax=Rhizobium lentis TaxID=1138194 RepID=UPI001C8327E2|nr:site-specific DNA-methyltransferase [Rhizobium lentis]MBX5010874.1 site-specific DNA-methyltransferase [Rhizobium lentis]